MNGFSKLAGLGVSTCKHGESCLKVGLHLHSSLFFGEINRGAAPECDSCLWINEKLSVALLVYSLAPGLLRERPLSGGSDQDWHKSDIHISQKDFIC